MKGRKKKPDWPAFLLDLGDGGGGGLDGERSFFWEEEEKRKKERSTIWGAARHQWLPREGNVMSHRPEKGKEKKRGRSLPFLQSR